MKYGSFVLICHFPRIPADPQTTISSPKIVGAHYSYTCSSGVMLPSQYSSRSASPSSSSSSKPTKTKSSSTSAHSHQHSYSSLSPLKSFDAFIKDTNDEWSDDLGYDLVNRSTRLSCSSSSSIRHPLSESSSSPLSHQSLPIQPSSPPSFPSITEEQPTPTYKGALKTDIDDLLIGKCKDYGGYQDYSIANVTVSFTQIPQTLYIILIPPRRMI